MIVMDRSLHAAVLALLLLPACQQTPADAEQTSGALTLRVACEEGAPGAVRETVRGRSRWYGPAQTFDIQSAILLYDQDGSPMAIQFEIDEAQQPAYVELTSEYSVPDILYRSIAYYVDGEFISASSRSANLFDLDLSPGHGCISLVPDGFTPQEAERLLAKLRRS